MLLIDTYNVLYNIVAKNTRDEIQKKTRYLHIIFDVGATTLWVHQSYGSLRAVSLNSRITRSNAKLASSSAGVEKSRLGGARMPTSRRLNYARIFGRYKTAIASRNRNGIGHGKFRHAIRRRCASLLRCRWMGRKRGSWSFQTWITRVSKQYRFCAYLKSM